MNKHNAQFSTSSLSIRCSKLSLQQVHSVFDAQGSVLNKLTQYSMLKVQISTSSLSIRCSMLSSEQAHSVFDAQGSVLNKLTRYIFNAQSSVLELGQCSQYAQHGSWDSFIQYASFFVLHSIHFSHPYHIVHEAA